MIRKMGQFDVTQRTSDGMFNASLLLKQWNKNNQKKKLVEFLRNSQTESFIEALKNEDKSPSDKNHYGDIEVITTSKGKNTKKGKTPDTTWMHPYLFIKFAMWLNPRFEIQVIRFVYDQLIAYRNDAGDGYNGLTNAVQRFDDIDYSRLAKALNWIVFDRHERGIRQTATQEQLKELTEIQKKLAFACDMGYIKTFDELINEMRRMYRFKHYGITA